MLEIRTHILACGKKTRETIDLIRAERDKVEAGAALPAIIAADCEYFDFFIELFDEAAKELGALDADMAARAAGGVHAERLRRIAGRATDGRRRCLEFFDAVSLDIRNQLVALQELSGLADQIEPKSAVPIGRRALFTRFFHR
jgi:hypothetical protein